ncbi:MAG: hypothetical protein HUJ52_03425, partial [Malacoplasma sp.]|nr:hypothetical protein [Malacoplasma sp.]
YNLDYDIDPNVFSTVSGTDFIEQNIPLKNKKFVKIGGDRVKWQKLTSIVFKHISPNCRKLNEHFLVCTEISTIDFSSFSQITHVGWSFLGTCLSLVYINMSYLTKVQEIGREFLYGCSALQKLYVPLKNPKTITVKSKDFMILTPLACTIHAGDFVDEYKTTSPWSGRAQHIVE